MNPAPSASPRLLCRVVRPWHAATGGAARHLETCADCRAHVAATDALARALRCAAPAWTAAVTPAPSTGFEQRLLRAVREPAAPRRSPAARLAWMTATALTTVVAVVLIRPPAPRASRITDAEIEALTETVNAASRGLVEKVIPATGALAADNPMQREFGAIYADARSAVGFLALNFLPLPPAEATPSSARPF